MTTFFPDVSHYQQGLNLTGAAACIAKATEGTSFVDYTYQGFKAQAAKLAIPFAAYHWIHAGDVLGQAHHAFDIVGPGVPLMIDDEDTRDGLSVARTLAFVNAYRALGGTVTLEYLPRWFWANNGSPDLRPLAAAGLSLVSSNYGGYSDTGAGWLPYGGVAPKIWQYTSSQVFNGYKCDFNAFKGTVAELRALFTGTATATKEVEDDMFLAQVTGQQAVWLSNGVKYRGVANYSTFLTLRDQVGCKHVVVKTAADLIDLCGEPEAPGPDPVTLTAEQMALVAAAAKAGAEQGAGGPTHDELVAAAEEGANRAEDS